MIRAAKVVPRQNILWYRDAPYAIREPATKPSPLIPEGFSEIGVDISQSLDTKLDACAAYETQLGFQFGGEEEMRASLSCFARKEARRMGLSGSAEVFLAASGCLV